MKCVGLILSLAFLYSVAAEFDNKLLITFQDVTEDGAISDSCQAALQLYVKNLNSSDGDIWALKMLDATSKIPVGILSLNIGELGQFSECLATESQDGLIQPKYCLGAIDLNSIIANVENKMAPLQKQFLHARHTIRGMANLQSSEDEDENENSAITNPGISWAICLPTDCSDGDVAEILGRLLGTKYASCQTKEDLSPPLTDGAIAAIVVLSIFAFLLVSSTLLDLYCRHTHTEPPHVLLVAFSTYSNGKKLFKISKNSNELTCLNGIRFLSMMWVIIGHVYSMAASAPVTNYMDVMSWTKTLRSMVIVSGTLSVDSFFLLSGLLVVYSFMKAKHHGVKFNIFQFYIHRYLRLTPALAAAVLVTAHLLKYMSSGPVWPNILSFEKPCQKYWWTTILYIQNYVNKNTCLPQTWYLSIDMQLYILSPLILFPLWKWPKIGTSLVVAVTGVFIIVPFCVAYMNELSGLLTNFENPGSITDYMTLYYAKTHTRAAPWLIGILIGYVMAKLKFQGGDKHLKFNKILVVVLWMICIAAGLTCVFGGHSTLGGTDYDVWANSFYIALVRPAWSVCLVWVIFACATGYGGPINWMLSLPIYQVLNRFTYSVYLIHYPLIFAYGFMSKTGIYFSDFNMAYSFWGLTMFSFGLSIIWVLAFESPIVILEKLMFSGPPKRKNKLEENGDKNGLPA